MLTQLRDMDLQLLRLFVTIVESGGFSAAQGRLGMAQSTISTQMAKLETRVGFRLCERGKSGFRLTPKGERVLQSTRRLLHALDTFTRDTQEVSDTLLGELRIGMSERLAPDVVESIARAVGRFRERAPDVLIEMAALPPDELEGKLVKDEVQLAIGYFSGRHAGLNYAPLFVEQQALFCGAAHPLFTKPTVGIDDIAQASTVARLYRMSTPASRLRGRPPTAFSENVDADVVFVLSGAHLGFLPDHIAAPWEAAGKMRRLLANRMSYAIEFQLATSKNADDNEVLDVFRCELADQFRTPARRASK
ncbi:LysR family transcriptional regulator [Burkholderia ubonensis]|uniref:LysR family transcriptional regulator n=1 Tax=Burkholderia ubonensis TaxID=101571 RepID=A0AA40UYQ3_9BURK|nr:LysR family transcriptional regulator [Burkholderia ubonensis]KVU29740.1 LysR family transcriptional regulator [Burkholderia ubonensis]KWZ60177.1 LysR family transcriptional regulator [Burkholderia ubonensis]